MQAGALWGHQSHLGLATIETIKTYEGSPRKRLQGGKNELGMPLVCVAPIGCFRS
jgi:hypothetical protein